jgi:hypothetical protein
MLVFDLKQRQLHMEKMPPPAAPEPAPSPAAQTEPPHASS